MSRKSIGDRFREARQSEEYQVAAATIEFTEEVFGRMEELGLGKSDLAGRLGTSPAYVTKLLRGNTNVTLKTMVRLARALDTELAVGLSDAGEGVGEEGGIRWFDVLNADLSRLRRSLESAPFQAICPADETEDEGASEDAISAAAA